MPRPRKQPTGDLHSYWTEKARESRERRAKAGLKPRQLYLTDTEWLAVKALVEGLRK
jgi:hypothetical protein